MSLDAVTGTFAGMAVVPITVIALSIPLIMRIIPRNSWYGFRTSKTLSSDGVWYQANHIGGVYLVIAGAFQLAGLVALLLVSPASSPDSVATYSMPVLLLPLIIASVAWFLRTRCLRG